MFLREVIIQGYRDRNEGHILAANYPEIAKQWNYDKNGALTPWDVTIGSSRKVWWKCSLGHEWEAVIFTRTLKSVGCPYCKGRCAWPGFNDLATLRPDIAAGWDYELNGEKRPERYTVHSHARVWWTCPKGHPSFQMKITERSYGHGCPICGRETVVEKLGHPVSQLSSDGEMVQTYPSVAKAAEANGISRKPIMHAKYSDVFTCREEVWSLINKTLLPEYGISSEFATKVAGKVRRGMYTRNRMEPEVEKVLRGLGIEQRWITQMKETSYLPPKADLISHLTDLLTITWYELKTNPENT